ncbi:MAG: glycosyltransferase family 87 protein [Chloroflexota bacterium]
MAKRRSSAIFYRAVVFLATAWTVAFGLFLIDNNLFSARESFQESDFIMTFYVAGHLAAHDRSAELYPQADLQSFTDTPFDRAAHALLPQLPKNTTGAFMYTPLIAAFFAPFSYLDPNLALFFWQAISVLALGLCSQILSRATGTKASELFFLSFLYLPVFLTLWAGQLGLVFGLLPLCLGYLLLLREMPLAAGLAWSLLLLKPQFFLVAAFVAIVSALRQRYRIVFGLVLGLAALMIVTIAMFSLPVTIQWLVSHRVSEAYFFSGKQGIPAHLLTGLPANILVLLPIDQRSGLKLPLYAAAAAMWLFGIWFCFRLSKLGMDESLQISSTFVIGLGLASLTSPHLLYYDLCVLLPAGALLIAKQGPFAGQTNDCVIAWIGWITVSVFLPFLLAFTDIKILPLLLELILLALFITLLLQWSRFRTAVARA